MTENFEIFLERFSKDLFHLFNTTNDINSLSTDRGLPDNIWNQIMANRPLSVAIPEEYGGRGLKVAECLRLLAAASYESLPLSLTFGINIALFLEPLAKYGHPEIQPKIFQQFLEQGAMGGLMITEPGYGSDALNMQSAYVKMEDGYHIKGQKHWQGLTGMADFWIVAARQKADNGLLARDIEFFVTKEAKQDQKIQVQEYYSNLGLYMIPYGLNSIDVTVPTNQKLQQPRTGIKMMLDILHRSRLQFPGMGMGFIKRMLDEALGHCNERVVSGKKLLELDSVQYQISKIQAAYTLCSGMCAHSATMSGIEHELSGNGMEANCMKALVTDLMQESAQLCAQLMGSSGYKIDHIVGRGIVDSRPFQIFEGSNEMLYTQIAENVIKGMKKDREPKLNAYLLQLESTLKIAPLLKEHLNVSLPDNMPQRQMVVLGKVMARLICMQYVQQMQEKGFSSALYENCLKSVQAEVTQLFSTFGKYNDVQPIVPYTEDSKWQDFI